MKKSIYSLFLLGVLVLLPLDNINDKSFPQFLQETLCFNCQSFIGNISGFKDGFWNYAGLILKGECNNSMDKQPGIILCHANKK